jgi:hypothetical protein
VESLLTDGHHVPVLELVTDETKLDPEDGGPVDGPRVMANVVLAKTIGRHHCAMSKVVPDIAIQAASGQFNNLRQNSARSISHPSSNGSCTTNRIPILTLRGTMSRSVIAPRFTGKSHCMLPLLPHSTHLATSVAWAACARNGSVLCQCGERKARDMTVSLSIPIRQLQAFVGWM